ncbi:MAG: hypothetical protein F6J90_09495 [Moorea sp. SIOASIH]|uniref:hypothetical protein n=1 Tax=Moorena sp. SIOASIH TaxID=2607817 RepID=UPI0013B8666D|nr:hypothetical protein [Moorena sp. SIOASIH]NEO36542.1 hypothetical protein [Moorena sp. SIOASIH]
MGETTAVAHGAWVCVRNLRPHRCLPRGNHSRSWGKPPRPRCLPKTALPPQDRAASLKERQEARGKRQELIK